MFADDVLRQGIQGISDLISQTGIINLDFADVKAVMESGGMAHLGIGVGKGEKAMADAAQNAIASPMLETTIDGARAVLINVTCNPDCSIVDINDAVEMITAAADSEANIIFGASLDESLGEDGTIHDDFRVHYIEEHIKNVSRAIDDGVDCRGYLYWGPIDVVSAGTGEMKKRYGFVYVDRFNDGHGTLERAIKQSYWRYKEIIESNGACPE